MAFSIRRLRITLLAGAALLVLVIAGFLGYARYRTHRFLAGLPGKLGVDIRRETNGYTYSQSVGGKTVMTLHAAKAVEHTGGGVTLHDVSMVLYGRKQDRADRISGAEFEYEQATGVVRAVGEVHIDLQAPGAPEEHGPARRSNAEVHGASERMIHVKTSGLVYLQKLGVAATDQALEFEYGGMTGHAVGAEYNSDTGVVILQSAVQASGLEHGTPVALLATHAELERGSNEAVLTNARYSSPGQTAQADHATLYLRSDGSPERIEAEGGVALGTPTAGRVTAPRAQVFLTAESKAERAHLSGGVVYESVSELREGHGRADKAEVRFDSGGQAEGVLLSGAVQVNERVRRGAGDVWGFREVSASRVMVVMGSGNGGKGREVRDAEAIGGARLKLVEDVGNARPNVSEMTGDTLRGHFVDSGKGAILAAVDGVGHTTLRRLSADKGEQTSAGDRLKVVLRPPASGEPRKQGKQQAGEQIERATQTGHVMLTSVPSGGAQKAAGGGAVTMTTATGEVAVYEGAADEVTLTGHAQVVEGQDTVAGDRIVLKHATGDAAASGNVRANYLQPNSTEPVHLVADRAELLHDAGRSVFFGLSKPARMWQSGSQVEAPVIEIDQPQRTLTAHGEGAASASPVHAVLVSAGGSSSGTKGQPSVVRIASGSMIYRDGARHVDFEGGVKVEDADGTMHARQASAFLRSAGPAGATSNTPRNAPMAGAGSLLTGGGIERIVATGGITVEQPGRRAAGEQLVYTAADGLFALTGTAAALPKLTDEAQGSVTGAELRFHTGDDSVTVLHGQGATERVRTVTRVRQK